MTIVENKDFCMPGISLGQQFKGYRVVQAATYSAQSPFFCLKMTSEGSFNSYSST